MRLGTRDDTANTGLRSCGSRGAQRKIQAIAVEGNGPTDIGARERSTRTRKLRSLSAWERRAGDSRRSTRMLEQAGLGGVKRSAGDSRRSTRELQPMSQAYALTRTAGKRDAITITEADRAASVGRVADYQSTNTGLRTANIWARDGQRHAASVGRPRQRDVITTSQHKLVGYGTGVTGSVTKSSYTSGERWGADTDGVAVSRDTDSARSTDR